MRRALSIIALSFAMTGLAHSAPAANLWARWTAHDPQSTATIDNSAYNAFLHKYVVVHPHGPNGVRYAAVSKASRHRLEAYIQHLESIHIDAYNRNVQRAYWTNLYNAETLHLVLKAYPVDSIRDIGGSFFHPGPWNEKVLTVEGVKLTLNDIEHRILRPIWPDGMTHYGVNCASISCPSLRQSAFTGANVKQALAAGAHEYINSPEGVHFKNGQLIVSKIYDWYQADFGGNAAGVIQHLRRFADPALAARLKKAHSIDDYVYNWSLDSEANVTALKPSGAGG